MQDNITLYSNGTAELAAQLAGYISPEQMKAFLDSSGYILTTWHDITVAGTIVAICTFAIGIFTGYCLKEQIDRRKARKQQEATNDSGRRQHP